MDGSIVLGSSQRKRLLDIYRGKEAVSANVRLRAHIILLLSEGQPWSLITAVLFCSTATLSRWKDRFESGGVEALLEENRGRAGGLLAGWAFLLVFWVKRLTPRGFGYCRSRWCCATLALVLFDLHGIKVSAETVRRCLHNENLVWRRPRPVPGPVDPRRDYKLRKIRELLKYLPDDEAGTGLRPSMPSSRTRST